MCGLSAGKYGMFRIFDITDFHAVKHLWGTEHLFMEILMGIKRHQLKT